MSHGGKIVDIQSTQPGFDKMNEQQVDFKDQEANEKGSERRASIDDGVFGQVGEEGPNYRDVGWMGTVVLMLKSQIGLGVLSIPSALDTLGLIPGVLVILGIGGTITWCNYVIGVFKKAHPEVYSIVDVGAILGGKGGKEFMGVAFLLWWICVSAAGLSSISVAFNGVSVHGTCTAVFIAVAAITGFLTGSIRTLGKVSWLAWVGIVSILVALFIMTVAVGVQDRPADAPRDVPFKSDYKLINHPSFTEGLSAVNSIVFAYAGTPAFFAIISEMRDQKRYNRSLVICQGTMTGVYILIGIIVYYFCGTYVATPALGSAGPLLKRVCYGIALPGLIVSTTLPIHYVAKYIFLRILRGSKHLVSNSPIHWTTWLSCTFGCTVLAYIITSSVPNFGSLVSLVGALLGTMMSFQPLGAMWLYQNWHKRKESFRSMAGVIWAIFVVTVGSFIMVAGSYSAIVAIIADYNAGSSAAFSCADNSNSV